MELNVKVPVLADKFYTDAEAPLVKRKMDEITATYFNIINEVSDATRVPIPLIVSFVFIESAGKVNAISSSGAVGLMQLSPKSGSDILVIENKRDRLRDKERELLTKYLGDRFTEGILKMKYLGDKVTVNGVRSATWVTKEDLLKPELNLLIGSIFLSSLMDESTKDGDLRLDKVVVRYNKGYFTKKGLDGDVKSVMANAPSESKAYIKKLIGTNGTLDLLI